MSTKYKFHNPSGAYFISFATVGWIDVFVRKEYCEAIIDSLNYCINHKSMQVYAWCIMPSHIHLIFSTERDNPGDVIRDFKKHTSKTLINLISTNSQESRKEWMLNMFHLQGEIKSNVSNYQFWQQDNHPIELWSNEVVDQKLKYLHLNPVKSGFVCEAEHWKYSSAIDYVGGKGLLNIIVL